LQNEKNQNDYRRRSTLLSPDIIRKQIDALAEPDRTFQFAVFDAVKRHCNSRWCANASNLFCDSFNQTLLELIESVGPFLTKRENAKLTVADRIDWAQVVASRVVARLSRRKVRELQPFKQPERSIALGQDTSADPDDHDNGVSVRRADWTRLHEPEDSMIRSLDLDRLPQMLADCIGSASANWLIDYGRRMLDGTGRPFTNAEKKRAARLRIQLNKYSHKSGTEALSRFLIHGRH
jgi:hypothetical protein